ncbi:MCM DNA helicase complex subunit, partial [Perkinsus olseni]
CATVGQLEFTIGDLPEFDSSIDTSSLWTFTVYLNRVPGSRPLTIPVVSGDMERLVFAPRLDAMDDEEIWGHVTNNGALEPVKMCMGKDKNGVLVLEYPRADNEYQDPEPTALSSPKEFWTEVDEIPTRKLCVTQGDRVLYFDSWSQLDTPYISATYATKQDRGSVLSGDSKDRSWEGFSVGVKLRNPDNSNHTSDWGVKGETEDNNENCEKEEEEKEEEEEQLHQTRWFSVSLNRGKLNIWAPDGPVKDTDEKILVFEHSRKESSWIIPEAWLRTGVPDADVDEALRSKQPLKSMNGYVYAQQFYGTVQSLHKSHSATGDEDGDGDDAAPAVTPPEISEKPPIQEQMMNMSKSFWHEREGREGRLQQLREKCQVMKDYNDNLASQLEEAEGLYKDLSEKVEQMKAKIGMVRRKTQCRLSFDISIGVTAGTHDMFATLCELGYHGCALNRHVTESAVSTHKRKAINRPSPEVRLPGQIAEEERRAVRQLNSFGLGSMEEGGFSFIVLDRVTVSMARSESLCHLDRLQGYDIVAIRPESDAVIWTLLGDETLRSQVDVICLDLNANGASGRQEVARPSTLQH